MQHPKQDQNRSELRAHREQFVITPTPRHIFAGSRAGQRAMVNCGKKAALQSGTASAPTCYGLFPRIMFQTVNATNSPACSNKLLNQPKPKAKLPTSKRAILTSVRSILELYLDSPTR